MIPNSSRYALKPYSYPVCRKSPYALVLRDAPAVPPPPDAWEDFSEHSLQSYFKNLLTIAAGELARLENSAMPYPNADQERFIALTESIIQARQLLDLFMQEHEG